MPNWRNIVKTPIPLGGSFMFLKNEFPCYSWNESTPESAHNIESCPGGLLFNLVNNLREFMFQPKPNSAICVRPIIGILFYL